jgi:hypothetical protein
MLYMRSLEGPSRQEPGCRLYTARQDKDIRPALLFTNSTTTTPPLRPIALQNT